MVKVIVVGGGSAGCGAAEGAVKAGAEVTLLERTDLLLGCALMCRWMRNAGRFVLCEEAVAMGGDSLIHAFDSLNIEKNPEICDRYFKATFPSKHAEKMGVGYLYETGLAEPTIRQLLKNLGVQIRFESRAVNVEKEDNRITAVVLDSGEKLRADAFVDTTGTAGGWANCVKHGNGCVMCPMFRCPTFGDRVSIATKAGAREITKRRRDGTPGTMMYPVAFYLGSLSAELQEKINEDGLAFINIKGIVDPREWESIAYSMRGRYGYDTETGEPIDPETAFPNPYTWEQLTLPILPSTGMVLVAGDRIFSYISYEKLRQIPGFEHAIKVWPQGSKGNFVNGLSITPVENSLKAIGLENCFVAGEKIGLMGMGEGMGLGLLAGHNAVRSALGKDMLVLPQKLITGEAIHWAIEKMETEEGLTTWYDSHGGLFLTNAMKKGLYITDVDEIHAKVKAVGLSGIYTKKLV
ncbi:NAD(P)/FAD-dependent oxidoreductase [Chloroflexota bacterium]